MAKVSTSPSPPGRSLLASLRLFRLFFVEAKGMIARDRMFYPGTDVWTISLVTVPVVGVFKTLDSYPMEPIGLDGKKHESKNPRSASDHISRCSIASTNSTSVRRKPRSRSRQPYTWNSAMHLHPSNLTSQPSIRQGQRRAC